MPERVLGGLTSYLLLPVNFIDYGFQIVDTDGELASLGYGSSVNRFISRIAVELVYFNSFHFAYLLT